MPSVYFSAKVLKPDGSTRSYPLQPDTSGAGLDLLEEFNCQNSQQLTATPFMVPEAMVQQRGKGGRVLLDTNGWPLMQAQGSKPASLLGTRRLLEALQDLVSANPQISQQDALATIDRAAQQTVAAAAADARYDPHASNGVKEAMKVRIEESHQISQELMRQVQGTHTDMALKEVHRIVACSKEENPNLSLAVETLSWLLPLKKGGETVANLLTLLQQLPPDTALLSLQVHDYHTGAIIYDAPLGINPLCGDGRAVFSLLTGLTESQKQGSAPFARRVLVKSFFGNEWKIWAEANISSDTNPYIINRD